MAGQKASTRHSKTPGQPRKPARVSRTLAAAANRIARKVGLEAAGQPRAVETARTILNLVRGYEIERLLNPHLDSTEFRRRIDWLLTPRATHDHG